MYRLRWCYEYQNGSRKFGMWNSAGPPGDLATKAWCHNKDIRYAIIEAKDPNTKEIKEIVRCPSDEFMNFQWIAISSVSIGNLKGSYVPNSSIVGITMLTTSCAVDCFVDGTLKKNKPRHTNQHFVTYGK